MQACQTQTPVRAAHWVLKLEKLTAGRSLEKHATLCHFRHILSNFILKRTKISHILLFIIYSFKWKCGLNSLQRAALNKQWGRMRPAGRQFDKPALMRIIIHMEKWWLFLNLNYLNIYIEKTFY